MQRGPGNAYKATVRCADCGFENPRPRETPEERTIHVTCMRCRMQVLTPHGRAWMAAHPADARAFEARQAARRQAAGRGP